MPSPHKGWYWRGRIPHLDVPGLVQSIGFRLHDSVPRRLLERWKSELQLVGSDDPVRFHQLQKRIARFADKGRGACYLGDDRIATLVEDALLHFDGLRYNQMAWCIMPNHVHSLIETFEGWPLASILHSWKSFTAKAANRILGRAGTFWMDDYYDRFVRDEEQFITAVNYIHDNPVVAGLVNTPHAWPYSSIHQWQPPGNRAARPTDQ